MEEEPAVQDWLPGSSPTAPDLSRRYVEWAPVEATAGDEAERELLRVECEAMVKYKAFSFSWDVFCHWAAVCTVAGLTLRGALDGRLAHVKAVPILAVAIHHLYADFHECVHNNLAGCPQSGATPRLNSLAQDLVACVCSLALGIGYRAHWLTHMEHHKFTNHDSKDPDLVVGGPFAEKCSGLAKLMLASLVLPFTPSQRIFVETAKGEAAANFKKDGTPTLGFILGWENNNASVLNRRIQVAVALLTGKWTSVFLLWWLPQQLAQFTITMVFAWLPHHPHGDVGRYKDTRVTLIGSREPWRSILSYLVFCGHDYHLVHHLYPRVPWPRMKRLFQELEPALEKRGARIEGGEGRPPVLLGAPGKVLPACGPWSSGWWARRVGFEAPLTEERMRAGALCWLRQGEVIARDQ